MQASLFEMPVDIGVVSGTERTLTLKTVQMRFGEREQTFVLPLGTRPTELVIDPNAWLLCEVEVRGE
jgi:hypothetical protein